MPVGTVRGRVELDAPALRTLKELERQGVRTQKQFERLGKEVDEFERNLKSANAEMRVTRQELVNTGRQSSRTARDMRSDWLETTRVVKREIGEQRRELGELQADLLRVGETKATAQVDVDGIARAITQVETLHARLRSLGRERVTPRLGLGGGFGADPPLPRAPRNARGPLRPRPPRGGGGGGPGGQGLRSIGFGPATFGSKGGIALIAGALPAVQALGGATTALAGSLAGGALGAGAIGLAGGGALAAGVAGLVAVAKPAIGPIGDAAKAQENYNKALADFGRDSDQAKNAKRELDQAFKAAPRGTRDLLRDLKGLREEWKKNTRPGQESFMQLLVGGTRNIRRFARGPGARAANRVTAAASREGLALSRFATGRTGAQFARSGSAMFDENLGAVRRSMQNSMEAFVNVMRASRPFLREATDWLERWTRGWASGTEDIGKTRDAIGEMVDHLRSWKNLGGATFRLMRDLLKGGAPEGQGMVDRLTRQLDKWDDWVQRNPEKVRDFFRRTVNSTIELAKGLAAVVKALSNLATLLSPVLDRFSQLVTLAGTLGMLQPGALTLGLGALRGFRGGSLRGGRGAPDAAGGSPGGGGAIVPVGGGGGRRGGAGRLGGGLGVRGVIGNWRENARIRNATFASGTMAERDSARALLAARGAQGLTLRGAMANFRGGTTYGLARSFGYGRAASGAAQVGAGFGRAGGAAMLGVRGAARAYWPVGLGLGVLDAAGFQGDQSGLGALPGRVQAGLSTATLGAISRPSSRAEMDDRAKQAAGDLTSGLSRGTTLGGLRRDVRSLEGLGGRRLEGMDIDLGGGAARTRRLRQIRDTLDDELEARRGMVRDIRHQRAEESRQTGGRRAEELQEGFTRRSRRVGKETAFSQVISQTQEQLGKLGPHGARALAAAQVQWAREVARGNPKMLGKFRDLEQSVIKRFGGMAKRVAVINGQIRVGNEREWGSIASAISSAARRGVSETTEEFKRLHSVAIGALRDMGFTKDQAERFFKDVRAGGERGRVAGGVVKAQKAGQLATTPSGKPITPSAGSLTRKAGGIGGPTPEDRAARAQAAQNTRGTGLMGAKPGLGRYAQDAAGYGLRVTSGLRAGSITKSGNVSLHSSGDAIDVSGDPRAMLQFARHAAEAYGSGLDELIHTPMGFGIKNGQRIRSFGSAVDADHFDHVHLGDRTPTGGGGLAGGLAGAAGDAIQQITLRGRRSRLGGVPGALSTAASAGMARGMEAFVNNRLGAMPGGGGAPGAGGKYNVASLAQLWRAAGGPANMARLMGAIAMAESGGDPNIVNSIGATGLWQIHPGGDQYKDPMTNARTAVMKYRTQGLGAWEAYTRGMHKRFLGAYRNGGTFVTRQGRGGLFAAGEGPNREEVTVRPHRPDRKPGLAGLGGGGGVQVSVAVSMGDVSIREEADIEKLAEKVGEKAGEKVLAKLSGGKELMD